MKRRLWFGLRLAFALAALALLFSRVPFAEVAGALRSARVLPLAIALLGAATVQLTMAERLARFMQAHEPKPRVWSVYAINLAARFYGLFLPAGSVTGFALRTYRLGSPRKIYLRAASAVMLDRIAATAALCLSGIGFWLAERPAESAAVPAVFLAVLSLLTVAFAGLSGRIRIPGRLRRRLDGVSARWSDGDTVEGALRDSIAHLPSVLVAVGALSIAAHLFGVVVYYSLGASLGLDQTLSFVTVGWLRSAVILATMIPISVSGIALREGAMLLLLTSYGVPPESALAFSLLVFAVTAVVPGSVGGLLELRRAGRR